MLKLLVLFISLCGAVQANVANETAESTESAENDPCNCVGCCGTPLSLVPGFIRKIAISPIAIFWDRGPTFAEW